MISLAYFHELCTIYFQKWGYPLCMELMKHGWILLPHVVHFFCPVQIEIKRDRKIDTIRIVSLNIFSATFCHKLKLLRCFSMGKSFYSDLIKVSFNPKYTLRFPIITMRST